MTKKYQVNITEYAYKQMEEIYKYIADELLAPDAASHLFYEMRKSIATLETMPCRHKLVDEEPWRSEGVRYQIVKNFYVYYWINEENKKVHITAVVYNKRDQIAQLTQMDKE